MEVVRRGRDVDADDLRNIVRPTGDLSMNLPLGGAFHEGKVRKLETQRKLSTRGLVSILLFVPSGKESPLDPSGGLMAVAWVYPFVPDKDKFFDGSPTFKVQRTFNSNAQRQLMAGSACPPSSDSGIPQNLPLKASHRDGEIYSA
jgi:hypothetical protein